MSLDDVIESVTSIGESDFKEAAYIAQKTVEYTNDLKSNQINKDEYTDLMADLKVDQLVASTAEDEEIKSSLQTYMSELLTLAESFSSI